MPLLQPYLVVGRIDFLYFFAVGLIFRRIWSVVKSEILLGVLSTQRLMAIEDGIILQINRQPRAARSLYFT